MLLSRASQTPPPESNHRVAKASVPPRRKIMQEVADRNWATLRGAGDPGEDISPSDCLERVARAEHKSSLDPLFHQGHPRLAMDQAMDTNTTRRITLRGIDDRVDEARNPSLEDLGRAEKAKAALLRTAASDLLQHAVPDNGASPDHKADQDHHVVLRTAMRHEVRGIAALEGRAGLEARTGLEGGALDTLAATSGASDYLERHDTQNLSAMRESHAATPDETPQTYREAWARKAAEMSPNDFRSLLTRARRIFITEVIPDSASQDLRVERATLLWINRQASASNPTAETSLKLNQSLLGLAPEGSDLHEEMLAIRDTCLDVRKQTRQSSSELD